jgi:hypothetical protein
MRRREFLKQAGSVLLILSGGRVLRLDDIPEDSWSRNHFRFAIASDGHYGQKDTEYEKFFTEIVDHINEQHRQRPFSFCMVNGDIVHDDKKWFPDAKKALDRLAMKYYVSQGNHDHVTPAEWEATWGIPVNHDFTINKNTFLVGTTSNEQGTYLCPDLDWFGKKLEEHRRQKNVFIFIHINPGKQTANAVDCPGFFELLAKYRNVRAVFNGHDHDQDGIKMKNEIPFIFDSHFGGNWGTTYRGFRVVELKKDNSLLTYILNPAEKINVQTINI